MRFLGLGLRSSAPLLNPCRLLLGLGGEQIHRSRPISWVNRSRIHKPWTTSPSPLLAALARSPATNSRNPASTLRTISSASKLPFSTAIPRLLLRPHALPASRLGPFRKEKKREQGRCRPFPRTAPPTTAHAVVPATAYAHNPNHNFGLIPAPSCPRASSPRPPAGLLPPFTLLCLRYMVFNQDDDLMMEYLEEFIPQGNHVGPCPARTPRACVQFGGACSRVKRLSNGC